MRAGLPEAPSSLRWAIESIVCARASRLDGTPHDTCAMPDPSNTAASPMVLPLATISCLANAARVWSRGKAL